MGKSNFINLLGGLNMETRQPPVVGDSLKSVTETLLWYEAYVHNQHILPIDTPGFDDSELPETEILRMMAAALANIYKHPDKLVRGVIYLYDISQNFAALPRLVSYQNLHNIVFVTTRWLQSPSREEAKQELKRLSELKAVYQKDMIAAGATAAEYVHTRDSATLIIQNLLMKPDILMQTQRQIVDGDMDWAEADAGKAANAGDDAEAGEAGENATKVAMMGNELVLLSKRW